VAEADARFRYWDLAQVARWGPSIEERVDGSSRLTQWRWFARGASVLLGQVVVDGLNRVPDTGAVILAVNHSSALDGALLFGALERPVSFLVKAEAFEPAGGLLGRLLISGAQLPVRRNQIDRAPVRLALELLDRGAILGVFPEGTRGDGRVRLARPGVGYFALRTGAPVLPVAVHGSAVMAHRRTGRRPVVRLSFGEPLTFERVPSQPLNRGLWLAATEQIRYRLAELVRVTEPNSAVASAS
jgi:1-acyl-sn-glycerol-3-phosphate acyltransferase